MMKNTAEKSASFNPFWALSNFNLLWGWLPLIQDDRDEKLKILQQIEMFNVALFFVWPN